MPKRKRASSGRGQGGNNMRKHLKAAQEDSIRKAPEPPLYRPLDPSRCEIRLLRILPSPDRDTTIYCQLEPVLLDDKPIYTALSYEWDPPSCATTSTRVVVNDQEVSATANLRHALSHLDAGVAYWIDALCINQLDHQERGRQVLLMKKIYHEAARVIVWLGLPTAEISLGMKFLSKLADDELFWDPATKLDSQNWLIKLLSEPLLSSHWKGIAQILQNSYWTRLWIVQEIVVSSEHRLPLQCGSDSVTLESLTQLRSRMTNIHYLRSVHATCAKLARNMSIAGSMVAWFASHKASWNDLDRPRFTLLQNLINYNEQQCRDPRDKIYALLGISRPFPKLDFPVSYNIPASEVYCMVAKFIIQGSRRLDILCECHRTTDGPERLPSWVPDWRYYGRNQQAIPFNMEGWDASGGLSTMVSFQDGERTLKTKGFFVGVLTVKSSRFDHSNEANTRKSFHCWHTFIKSTLRFSGQSGVFGNTHKSTCSTTLEILYDTTARISWQEKILHMSCPLSEFESYIKRITSEPELTEASEVPLGRSYAAPRLAWMKLCAISLFDRQISLTTDKQKTNALTLWRRAQSKLAPADLTWTVGYCTSDSEPGDIVVVLRGCKYPVLLRRVGHRFQVVNSMYVYGFMRGEAVDRFPEVDIELV